MPDASGAFQLADTFAATAGLWLGDVQGEFGFEGNAEGYWPALNAQFGVYHFFTGTAEGYWPAVAGAFTHQDAFSGHIELFLPQLTGFSGAIGLSLFNVSGAFADTLLNHAAAFVLNVHTQESTRYSHYPFSHIITIGGKEYGVRADGLYLLAGPNDVLDAVAMPVNGRIMSMETDFGSFHSSRCPYLYVNGDSQVKVTPYCDSVEKLPHLSSFGGRKTHLARGNSARYWRFKIENIVRLEGIEPLPEQRQRRVK